MDINGEEEDEEFGFSRNYFLAKELGSSSKKSTHKLSDIGVVDEQAYVLITRTCFSSFYKVFFMLYQSVSNV